MSINHLGDPVPNRDHAVSVSLPLWDHVVGYEEGRPEIMAALRSGYPRFVFHPIYKEACAAIAARLGVSDHSGLMLLPSVWVAKACADFIGGGRLAGVPGGQATAVIFPIEKAAAAKSFWQHTGLIVSSRWAEDILAGRLPDLVQGEGAKEEIREGLSKLSGADRDDVYLFPTGMAAIFSAWEWTAAMRGTTRSIQLGFPYLDTLKIQQVFGRGSDYIPYADNHDLGAVDRALSENPACAVFCEVPGNPLLRTVDLGGLKQILKPHRTPLVIDDTLGTWRDVDVMPYADVAVTSLTKYYSGVGDAMGGSLILNKTSPFYPALKQIADQAYEDLLYPADATVLAQNGRGFAARMATINSNAEALADFLKTQDKIKDVHYPKYSTPGSYQAIRRTGGGYGGLLSMTFKNAADAPVFYDRLDVAKGPSLGTDFTLACPYTILAHFNERSFAEANDVDFNLVRVSVGREDQQQILKTFRQALQF